MITNLMELKIDGKTRYLLLRSYGDNIHGIIRQRIDIAYFYPALTIVNQSREFNPSGGFVDMPREAR